MEVSRTSTSKPGLHMPKRACPRPRERCVAWALGPCHRPTSVASLPQRLMRDFKRLQLDPPQGVNGSPNPDNIMLWNAVIFGPEETPWDGGARGSCAAALE